MLQLSSTGAAVERISHGHTITAEAYTLHGPVLFALADAARRGAAVHVRLAAHPFDDPDGRLARENARVANDLRALGADAALTPSLHAKALDVDGALYLDEKNWERGDIVLRASDGTANDIATIKHEALAREAALLRGSKRGDDIIAETESFGCCNAVYSALKSLACDGDSPRLLVAQRELCANAREQSLLEDLVRDGVRVRVCRDSEKLAAAGDCAWLGSANATPAFGSSDLTDWGVCTQEPSIVAAVRTRLEATWNGAAEFKARKA